MLYFWIIPYNFFWNSTYICRNINFAPFPQNIMKKGVYFWNLVTVFDVKVRL